MNTLNGVQLNSRAGLDMRTQYSEINNLPNPDSPQANTLSNNPIYNMLGLDKFYIYKKDP